MKKITLYGAGGHCFAVVELIRSLDNYHINRIYDDNPKESNIVGIPVQKTEDIVSENTILCITIGDNLIRKKISEKYIGADFPSFAHASAVQYPSVTIGKGTVVLPNSVLDAAVSIGDFCIINNNASVSHNAILGNYVHVAINAAIAGGVSIGEGTLVGAGSVILPDVKIGKWAVIGAGTIITKDIPDFAVVYGNPARIVKSVEING